MNKRINLEEMLTLPFQERIDSLDEFLDNDNTSDEYDGFLVQLLFNDKW